MPHFPVVYFGILKAGAIVVPLNVLLKPAEIAFHLRDADAVAYFCFEGTPELPMAGMGKAAFDEVDSCQHFIVMPRDPGGAAADRRGDDARRPDDGGGQPAARPSRRARTTPR